jgi:uncharacterized protein YdhG (YjbR/CyaY superfamily)
MSRPTPVRDYLATLGEPERAAYERVLVAARAEVPDAEEGTSYGMPALLHRGRPLLGLHAARSHLGLYPFSPAVIDALRDRLEGFSLSKGTIRFGVDQPPPDAVIRELVALRAREIDDG